MAEIKEVFDDIQDNIEDTTNKLKKKFKEKPVFYSALIVVVIFALYKFFSTNGGTTEETVTNAYVPTGYDGYPKLSDSMLEDYNTLLDNYDSILNGGVVSGGGSDVVGGGTTSDGTVNGESSSFVEDSYIFDTSYYDDLLADLRQDNEDLLNQITLLEGDLYGMEQEMLKGEMTYTEDGEIYNGLGDLIYSPTQTYKVLFPGEEGYEEQIERETANNKTWRDNILQQMQANSAAYSKATTTAEKEALHSANVQLAKGAGLTFDSASGKWLNPDGSEAWEYSKTTAQKNTILTTTTKPLTSTTGSKSYGGVYYDSNVDYAQKIKDAKASGASQSVIDQLTAQRNAKIAGDNLNADGTKSGTSWGGSSTTKKTTTSSGKTVTTGGGGGSIPSTKTGGTVNPTVSYDKNVDYAAEIKKAKASGASQATINKLTAQRNAKIAGENLNADGTKKK